MNDQAAERPFYLRAPEPFADPTVNPADGRTALFVLQVLALAGGLAVTFVFGMPKAGMVGTTVVARIFHLLTAAALPLLAYAAVAGVVLTLALAFGKRRKDGRRGWIEDFMPLVGSAVTGGLLALMITIAIDLPVARAESAVTAAAKAFEARTLADNRAFNAEINSVIPEGGLLDGDRLSRDRGYRRTSALIASCRKIIARYRGRADDLAAESRAAVLASFRSNADKQRALQIWERRMSVPLERVEDFWNGHEELADSVEDIVAFVRTAPGQWEGDRFMFNRLADLRTLDEKTNRHRALAVDIANRQQGITNPRNPVIIYTAPELRPAR